MTAFEISYILLWAVTCLLVVGLIALYSAFGALNTRPVASGGALDLSAVGPALGERVEVPVQQDLRGRPVSPRTKRWIFASPGCAGCERVKELLRDATPEQFEAGVVVGCRGRREDVVRWAADIPSWASVAFDEDGRLFAAFNVDVTPYYVLLDEAGACDGKGVTDATLKAHAHESTSRGALASTAARRARTV